MSSDISDSEPSTTPPGEGERRAMRGYVPQYDLGARLIYEALASGQLRWIGLADRTAGAFDDIVLGLSDRIAAHQLKTSRDPEPFSIRTILLGTEKLLGRMADAYRRLQAEYPDATIETVYVCDDYPRTNDEVSKKAGVSSAAFLRAHEVHRLTWGLSRWKSSAFGNLIAKIQAELGYEDTKFEEFWRQTRFIVRGEGRFAGLSANSSQDQQRLSHIAATLPRLVIDEEDKDRWTKAELLDRLGWQNRFELRHLHAFPVDAFYETNKETQDRLQTALSTLPSGYIGLIGPPGCGKSTLLAAGLLPSPRAAVVRYVAFIPNEGHGLGRAEAFDFLHDLVNQLKQQHLGNQIVPGTELPELRKQLKSLLEEASTRFKDSGVRTILVVDGLDHIPREERPERSLLSELPLPQSIPEGVIFVLGSQRLDLNDMPPSVIDQASEDTRRIDIAPLQFDAVNSLAASANLPSDVDRHELYARCEGHPLSTRYVIGGLLNLSTVAERKEWLENGPAFDGDVDSFYRRAWRDLSSNHDAQRVMSYLSLAEGSISESSFDDLVGERATDAAWTAAGHLLIRDRHNCWAIFHNSFRLFIRAQSNLRNGRVGKDRIRRRYQELAAIAEAINGADPQRWMELRYRSRAGDHDAVARLATPKRFRDQFVDGDNPSRIHADMDLAMETARVLRRADLMLDLVLARHEINMRSEAIGDEIFDAFIELGDNQAASSVVEAEGTSLTAGKGYELVDTYLRKGDEVEARRLFHKLEPIEILLGSEPVDEHRDNVTLKEWAERALIFREPAHFLRSLDRLHVAQQRHEHAEDIDDFRDRLKLFATRGQLIRNPELDAKQLAKALEIDEDYLAFLLLFAARGAFRADHREQILERFQEIVPLARHLPSDLQREAALMAMKVGCIELAIGLFEDLEPPSFKDYEEVYSVDELKPAIRQILAHAELGAFLGQPFVRGRVPESPLMATFQNKL